MGKRQGSGLMAKKASPIEAKPLRCCECRVMLEKADHLLAGAHLRRVQKELCGLFRRPFPAMMASVRTENKTFDSFMDQPFLDCQDGEEIQVAFAPTDDPFFYDLADRRSPSVALEDELTWEEERASGSTALDLQAWLKARYVAEE